MHEYLLAIDHDCSEPVLVNHLEHRVRRIRVQSLIGLECSLKLRVERIDLLLAKTLPQSLVQRPVNEFNISRMYLPVTLSVNIFLVEFGRVGVDKFDLRVAENRTHCDVLNSVEESQLDILSFLSLLTSVHDQLHDFLDSLVCEVRLKLDYFAIHQHH